MDKERKFRKREEHPPTAGKARSKVFLRVWVVGERDEFVSFSEVFDRASSKTQKLPKTLSGRSRTPQPKCHGKERRGDLLLCLTGQLRSICKEGQSCRCANRTEDCLLPGTPGWHEEDLK